MADKPAVHATSAPPVQQHQQLFVLSVLVVAYALVPFGALISFAVEIVFGRLATGEEPIVDATELNRFLSTLGGGEAGVTQALHKLILPFAALFIGANFTTIQNSALARWLLLVPLAGVVAALVAAALFDAFATAGARAELIGLPAMLRDAASNLGVVLMLCIGQALEKRQ